MGNRTNRLGFSTNSGSGWSNPFSSSSLCAVLRIALEAEVSSTDRLSVQLEEVRELSDDSRSGVTGNGRETVVGRGVVSVASFINWLDAPTAFCF